MPTPKPMLCPATFELTAWADAVVTVAAEEITDAADERTEDTTDDALLRAAEALIKAADALDALLAALAVEAPVAETVAGQEAMVGTVMS